MKEVAEKRHPELHRPGIISGRTPGSARHNFVLLSSYSLITQDSVLAS